MEPGGGTSCRRRSRPASRRVRRRPSPRRDRRHLDGRLRRARPRARAPGTLLRRRRPLGCALARRRAETPAGAFDDAEDFARHDVLALARARRRPLGGTPVWIDVGRAIPSSPPTVSSRGCFGPHGQPVQFHSWPGGHEGRYWWAHEPAYLAFYAAALARASTLRRMVEAARPKPPVPVWRWSHLVDHPVLRGDPLLRAADAVWQGLRIAAWIAEYGAPQAAPEAGVTRIAAGLSRLRASDEAVAEAIATVQAGLAARRARPRLPLPLRGARRPAQRRRSRRCTPSSRRGTHRLRRRGRRRRRPRARAGPGALRLGGVAAGGRRDRDVPRGRVRRRRGVAVTGFPELDEPDLVAVCVDFSTFPATPVRRAAERARARPPARRRHRLRRAARAADAARRRSRRPRGARRRLAPLRPGARPSSRRAARRSAARRSSPRRRTTSSTSSPASRRSSGCAATSRRSRRSCRRSRSTGSWSGS